MATCGVNLSIGMLTFSTLITAGIVLGFVFGFGVGLRQTYDFIYARTILVEREVP